MIIRDNMKKNNSERNAKTFVLIAVIVLAIGYAIITTSIIVIKKYPDVFIIKKDDKEQIEDNTEIDAEENFNVHYLSSKTSPTIIGGTGTATISEDKKSASFYVNNIVSNDDRAYIKYDIYNDSNGYNANIDINITNSNPEYFKVSKEIENDFIREKNKTTVTFIIELIKSPINTEETTTVSGTIVAKPVKK